MPTTISPVITDAGLSAAINANASGVQLAITHVVLGSGKYTPSNTSTIQNRREKASIAGGFKVGDNGFRINVLFSSYAGVEYDAGEIGFYAGDPDAGGVLFSLYSHPSSTIVRRNALDYVAQYGMAINRVPSGSVTITIDPSASQALALIANHENAADPHTQYAKKTEVNALLQTMAPAVAVAGGTANAITATFDPVIATLTHGMRVLVRATAANTAAAVTFKANGTAAVAIKKGNDLPLEVGDIAGAGHWLELVYDGTLSRWMLENPATGVNVAALFAGVNQAKTSNGWQKMPGGLILQWGRLDGYEYQPSGALGQQADWTGTFPIAFPNGCLSMTACAGELSGSNEAVEHNYSVRFFSATSFGITVMRLAGASGGASDLFGCRYMAIGH